MARIRSIHPSLFTDEAWVSCSPVARILYIGLMTDADDQGLFEWKPLQIKMRLLPADAADIPLLLEELVGANLIAPLDSGGKKLGAIRKFRTFQRPKKPHSAFDLPHSWRKYVGLKDDGSEHPQQKEEGGGRKEDGGGISPLSAREVAFADLNRMKAEAEEAGGDALASMAVAPGLANLSGLIGLLSGESPCDWRADVLPAISAAAAWHREKSGPGSMTSWKVALRIAPENRDRRLASLSAPKPPFTPRSAHDRPPSPSPAFSRRQANFDRAFTTPALSPADT